MLIYVKSAGYRRGFPRRPQGKSGNDFKLEGVACVEWRLGERRFQVYFLITGERWRRVFGDSFEGLSRADASSGRVRVAEPGCLGSGAVSLRVKWVLLAPEGS